MHGYKDNVQTGLSLQEPGPGVSVPNHK